MAFPENDSGSLRTGQLRRDIQLFPGQLDENGMPTWTLFDPVSDKYFRISEREHLMISLLYESRPIDDFYDKSITLGSTIDRHGVFNVIAFLMANNLMMPVYGSTEKRLRLIQEEHRRAFWPKLLQNYLFFRIPLVNPDAFIESTAPFVRTIFSKWTLLILALISACGYLMALANWGRLFEAVVASLTLSGLLKYALTITVLKAFHELAHAYVAKSFGVRIRRFGIGIMVFFPRLFTDITDTWRMTDSRKKALIDAAGIILELFAGGFAALLWLNSPPSAFATVCFYVFAISAANTLLVNGNPFIKYDGYYMLMDLVNIDNLQQRSFQAVNDLSLKYLFGIARSRRPPLANPAKNSFLIAFGILGFLYRIFLYTSIILIIYCKFAKALGIALVLLEIYILLVKPVLNQLGVVMAYRAKIKRLNLAATIAVATILAATLLTPMPWSMALPCEVKSGMAQTLYAPADGYLQSIDAQEGAKVSPGARIALLHNPDLEMDLLRKEADMRMAKIEYGRLSASSETHPQASVLRKRIELVDNDIAELKRRLALLEIRAASAGEVCYFNPDVKTSKWLRRGEAFGTIFDPNTAAVIAYANESEAGNLRQGDNVRISLNGELSKMPGVVKSINKVPERSPIPSPLLSPSGGPIRVKDTAKGWVYEEPVYQVVIAPFQSEGLHEGRTGTAFIRKPQSIAVAFLKDAAQWMRRLLSF